MEITEKNLFSIRVYSAAAAADNDLKNVDETHCICPSPVESSEGGRGAQWAEKVQFVDLY